LSPPVHSWHHYLPSSVKFQVLFPTYTKDWSLTPFLGGECFFHSGEAIWLATWPSTNLASLRVLTNNFEANVFPSVLAPSDYLIQQTLVIRPALFYGVSNDWIVIHAASPSKNQTLLLTRSDPGTMNCFGVSCSQSFTAVGQPPQVSFVPCPAGTYKSLKDAFPCLLCPPGTFSNTTGATNCTPCGTAAPLLLLNSTHLNFDTTDRLDYCPTGTVAPNANKVAKYSSKLVDFTFPVSDLESKSLQQLLLSSLFSPISAEGSTSFFYGFQFYFFFWINFVVAIALFGSWILSQAFRCCKKTKPLASKFNKRLRTCDLFSSTYGTASHCFRSMSFCLTLIKVANGKRGEAVELKDSFGAVVTLYAASLLILSSWFVIMFYVSYDPYIVLSEKDPGMIRHSANSHREVTTIAFGSGVNVGNKENKLKGFLDSIRYRFNFTFNDFRVRFFSFLARFHSDMNNLIYPRVIVQTNTLSILQPKIVTWPQIDSALSKYLGLVALQRSNAPFQ